MMSLLTACPSESGPSGKPPPKGQHKPDPKKPQKPLPVRKLAELPKSLGAAPVAPDKDLSFQFDQPMTPPSKRLEAPLSLTASDGTGLKLISMEASGVLEAPLAFTELKLVFENPQSRVMEGRFKITLPTGATISRFAMKIGQRWQEGEVVERQAARRAYEDFLHRRQDPALLEQGAANEFTARVFPIPSRGRKELIISYSQELESKDSPYRIPLVGLPQLGMLKIRALIAKVQSNKPTSSLGGTTASHEVIEVVKEGWVPDRDFEVDPKTSLGDRSGLRHGNLVVARLTPVVQSQPESVRSMMFMVDTSASRALGFTKQLKLLQKLTEGLKRGSGGDTKIAVAAFDQDVQTIYEGPVSGFSMEHITALRSRRAMGASDLGRALDWAKTQQPKGDYKRLLLLTDGVSTAGDAEGDALLEKVRAIGGLDRVDAVAVGGIRDEAMLKRLVTASPGKHGVVADGDQPIAVVGRKLSQKTTSGLKVKVDGARWVWPTVLDGYQAGDQVLIYADLPEGKEFKVTLGGNAVDAGALTVVERPLIERAWVKARIAKLLHQRDTVAGGDADMRAALKKQVIDLSVKHRVLSPFTALLVLETERDYRRFNIDRKALADILTVGSFGLTVVNRSAQNAPIKPTVPTTKLETAKADKKMAQKPRPPGRFDDAPATGGAPDPQSAAPAPAAPPRPPADLAERSESASVRGPGGGGRARGEEGRMRERNAFGGNAAPAESAAEEEAPAAEPALRRTSVSRRPPRRPRPRPTPRRRPPPPPVRKKEPPYKGKFAKVMSTIKKGDLKSALRDAQAWREEEPGDVMALIALGEVYESKGDLATASRAYGSLIDLFPSRADLRRFAGERLEKLASEGASELAADTYQKAAEQRPDHPASHRLLAFMLVKLKRYSEAFEAMEKGLSRSYPSGRFRGVRGILEEDLGLIAAAWSRAEPAKKAEIEARVKRAGGRLENGPSLRFVLNWETDANDVDFHIYDGKGGHAYYRAKNLPSGGRLYADVTTGYGPECFTIRKGYKQRTYPYKLQAHYYRRGPMGYGMGKLQIIDHDGQGNLRFEERPFVVMVDGAFVELGKVK